MHTKNEFANVKALQLSLHAGFGTRPPIAAASGLVPLKIVEKFLLHSGNMAGGLAD